MVTDASELRSPNMSYQASPNFLFAAILCALVSAGCATQASVAVQSQPEGAYLTVSGSGEALGIAPVTVYYDAAALLKIKDAGGCYLVRGFEARWISGATATLPTVRLCGSNVGKYEITFSRNPAIPGFEKDLQFSLQLKALRAQEQQAKAAEDAAAAAILRATAASQSSSINCTSMQMGNMVQTTCR